MGWKLLWLCVIFYLAACGRCKNESGHQSKVNAPAERGRLVILGFDGVDPRWLEQWSQEGHLPALRTLMTSHGGRSYRRLGSTNPPQSPVAWTSFATGTRPGSHGIYDFIARDLPKEPGALPVLPRIATTSFEPQTVGPPVARNLRSGIPFWKTLADDGVRMVAIHVPYSFPPDPMREGRMISGLGVPDLRGTNSTFTYVGRDRSEGQLSGGVVVHPQGEGAHLTFEVGGPWNPAKHARAMLQVDIKNTTPDETELNIDGTSLHLKRGAWSPWVDVRFRDDGRETRGILKFVSLQEGAEPRIFVSPVNFHPEAPYSPFSYPIAYASHMARRLGGYYKTVGWDHDTSALNEEVLNEALFLEDVNAVETQRKEMLVRTLRKDDWDMLIWVSTATDRVTHMFYRLMDPDHPRYDAELALKYGNAVQNEYKRMDATVSEVLAHLKPEDTLLVLSDHGFHNYRRGLHVNQWLLREGYLRLKNAASSSDGEFFKDVDWSQTKAYALGTGQVYLNLRNRERDGIVSAKDASALLQELRLKIVDLKDEEKGGVKPVRAAYLGTDVFRGHRSEDAPDLQIAFRDPYRTSWETILGGVPKDLFADNKKKWSGDHAASDVADTPGILVSNRPLRESVEIVDLAPTALSYFGRSRPAHYVGRTVLEN